RKEMLTELPEVDAILGTANYQDIVSAVEQALQGQQVELFTPLNRPVPELPRLVSTAPRWAYFRIAEGCDNHCAFCIIPALRGPYRSRSIDSLLEEARLLAESGVQELIVVAQDITRYGEDIFGEPRLAALLKELCKLNFRWIRLHYLYPEVITDELIDVIATEEKIVKYMDIPIQHINDEILRRMNRHTNSAQIRSLFKKLRERIPGLVLRTSLIAGLPGEGKAEFEELCEFLREARIERAGIFPFSPEEGTPAARMEDRCDEDEARRRADLVMELQAGIMDEWYESFVGREIEVFVQGREDLLLWGRSYADSPDIDGRVLFGGWAEPGEIVKVEITAVDNGEWIGQQV
ncbi:MAG: 30S ribosomal protein S12 methylthiotransferase RimO, partial [Oscillospiraceae bacterium]|nr:30S ribosomal protein S12 methylthiotransferase RimO [Oscillospiraceae bacterium]